MGNCLTLLRCAEKCLDTLSALAEDAQNNDLRQCGSEIAANFSSALRDLDYQQRGQELAKLVALSYHRMTSVHHSKVQYCWRRLYTDATLALICSAVYNAALDREKNDSPDSRTPDVDWKNWIKGLDMIIIIAGAPGEGRLEMVYDLIYGIQSGYDVGTSAPPVALALAAGDLLAPPPHGSRVPLLGKAPTMAGFERLSSAPFMLHGWASDWAAMKENHDWSRPSYLLSVAGPGRVVPVEIGADYRQDNWSQELMEWEDFLKRIGMLEGGSDDDRPVYLAQHDLFSQFYKLRNDVEIPDYVYAAVGEDIPAYQPPANEDGFKLNVWLGPKGMVSPAHTDPYFNLYTQIVGRKTVWLAPAGLQQELYPFRPHAPSLPVSSKSIFSTSLENTSSIDVFSPPPADKPLYRDKVIPKAMCCLLEPGDMLFIPCGWWHAMRSEDISLSVSMWF